MHAAPLGKPVYSAMGFQMGHEMELKLRETALEVRATWLLPVPWGYPQRVHWWHLANQNIVIRINAGWQLLCLPAECVKP